MRKIVRGAIVILIVMAIGIFALAKAEIEILKNFDYTTWTVAQIIPAVIVFILISMLIYCIFLMFYASGFFTKSIKLSELHYEHIPPPPVS